METRERSLLAEAIHDEPIQRIVAGILRLDHLSTRLDPATRNEVDEVTEQLVTTVDWLRDLIVVALTPPDLSAGLGPALAGLARSIFTATPTVFTVVGPDHVPLSVPAKEAVYRIFREALGNVRKHAQANNATLRHRAAGRADRGQPDRRRGGVRQPGCRHRASRHGHHARQSRSRRRANCTSKASPGWAPWSP